MLIGVPLETVAGETRVAVTPETVKKLKAQGHVVRVQSGAGVAASVTDAAYEAAGAEITTEANPESTSPEFFARLRPTSSTGSEMHLLAAVCRGCSDSRPCCPRPGRSPSGRPTPARCRADRQAPPPAGWRPVRSGRCASPPVRRHRPRPSRPALPRAVAPGPRLRPRVAAAGNHPAAAPPARSPAAGPPAPRRRWASARAGPQPGPRW